MSTHIGRFRPGLVPALVKVAMIGTWRGRTFLDDNRELDDVVGFVPEEPAEPLRLPLGGSSTGTSPVEQPAVAPGHSVAA
jgi:hypothetical protein